MSRLSSLLIAMFLATAATAYAENNTPATLSPANNAVTSPANATSPIDATATASPASTLTTPVNPLQTLHLAIIGEQIHLDKSDIADISTTNDFGAPALQITLTDSGTQKLQQFTNDHLNQTLQISWDDDILSQSTVMTVLPGKLVIVGPSQEKVHEVLKSFQQG